MEIQIKNATKIIKGNVILDNVSLYNLMIIQLDFLLNHLYLYI